MPKMNVIPSKGLVQSPGSGFLIDGATVASSAQSLDQLILTTVLLNVSSVSETFVVTPHAGTLTAVYSSLGGAIAAGDATLTVKVGGSSAGTITIANVGSAAGDVDSLTGLSTAVTQASAIEVETNGGSTNASKMEITFIIRR